MTHRSERFRVPDFGTGHVELRLESGEVAIYASPEGLERLVKLCQDLLRRRTSDHIHLQDYELLTSQSLPGVVAVYLANERSKGGL